jgi:hypothetical protein
MSLLLQFGRAPRGGTNSTLTRSPKWGARGAPKRDAKERRANGPAYRDLSDRLFEPERLEELLRGYLDQAIDGQARVKEKLRQAREARGDVEAKISRLLALVETGAMEPNDPALKDRLVGLRLQKTELEQDIARLQDAQDTSGLSLNAEKLGKLPSHWGP